MLPVDTRHHEETMAWLEDSLGHARARGQAEAEALLEAARTEVELEAEYARVSNFARRLLARQSMKRREADGRVPDASLGRVGE